ncbi:MAG: hypothetical protein Q7T80_14235 [Methanoregula sp.]|nr:hypothetical protein [Methanoregula sp.]
MRMHKIHPLLTGIIHTALQACEGIRFHSGDTCRYCGSPQSGYDERKKRFAILLKDDLPCPVHVIIQRSHCRSCGKISEPSEPFYAGTRVGSPVVDLCRSLTVTMPYSRVSTCLERMGVQVDRWSVRHYAQMPLPEVPSLELFGMQIPQSIVSLSTVAVSPEGPGPLDMDDVLLACNYPFIPFSSCIDWLESAPASLTHEQQQKLSSRHSSGFSRYLGIVIIGFCILANIVQGTASYIPEGLMDLHVIDCEVMSVYYFGAL